jgi:hypothetical protein
MAVVLRLDCLDYIGVYSLGGGTVGEAARFRARSNDIATVRWVGGEGGDRHLVTVDSPLTYRCCIYTPAGEVALPLFSLFH